MVDSLSGSTSMEDKCSFSKLVGGPCGLDTKYPRNTDIIQLSFCKRDVGAHISKFGIPDISTEVELILSRASIYSKPATFAQLTICPLHRCHLGTGWRRGADRCRVPDGLAKHKQKRSARRGIGKRESKFILRSTGIFVAVGSGRFKLGNYLVLASFSSKTMFYYIIFSYMHNTLFY